MGKERLMPVFWITFIKVSSAVSGLSIFCYGLLTNDVSHFNKALLVITGLAVASAIPVFLIVLENNLVEERVKEFKVAVKEDLDGQCKG